MSEQPYGADGGPAGPSSSPSAGSAPTPPAAPPAGAAPGEQTGEQTGEQAGPQPGEQTGGQQPAETSNQEAARYRRQLRDTETQRDALADRVAGYERGEVEQIARQAGMHDPADVWLFGVTLDDCRAEDGTVSAEAVRAAVAKLTTERPHLAVPQFTPNPGQGTPAGAPPPASWSDVLGRR